MIRTQGVCFIDISWKEKKYETRKENLFPQILSDRLKSAANH